jgi:hypothetical protein
MRLAKQHLDVGIFTNRIEEQLAFWQGDGPRTARGVPLGGGMRQYRHAMNGSVFGSTQRAMHSRPRRLQGTASCSSPRMGSGAAHAVDPDGNAVTLVPPVTRDHGRWRADSPPDRSRRAWLLHGSALGWDEGGRAGSLRRHADHAREHDRAAPRPASCAGRATLSTVRSGTSTPNTRAGSRVGPPRGSRRGRSGRRRASRSSATRMATGSRSRSGRP